MFGKNKNKGAFTLVEVFIAVLILIVVASVVVPMYQKIVLKSRAKESIKLLNAVRTKQAKYYARNKSYFGNFKEMSGTLTNLKEELNSNNPARLKIGNYEVELRESSDCAIVHYRAPNILDDFSFAASYKRNGLGCNGPVCAQFKNEISGSVEAMCSEQQESGFSCFGRMDSGFCTYPRVQSSDGCGCECSEVARANCRARQKAVWNEMNCSCRVSCKEKPSPDPKNNYWYWDEEDCDWKCSLAPANCSPRETYDYATCSCICANGRLENGDCACPSGQIWNGTKCVGCIYDSYNVGDAQVCCSAELPVSDGKQCNTCPPRAKWDPAEKKCKCEKIDELGNCTCPEERPMWTDGGCVACAYQFFNVIGDLYTCCTKDKPVASANTCIPCPEGSTWNPEIKQCQCPASKIVVGSSCVCDIANGWKAATEGTAVENGCCNTEINTYSEDLNQNICCPAGVQAFRWRTDSSQPFKAGPCCTADRPYAINTYWTDIKASSSPLANCRKCPSELDTWDATSLCHPCPAGTYGVYNSALGYAECKTCASNQIINGAGNGCECNTAKGWKAANEGVGIENGCCNTNKNTYFPDATQNICCPAGVQAFRWRTDDSQAFKPGPCCTEDRPYAINIFWTDPKASGTAKNLNCRKCQKETDTWDAQTGCHSCPAGTYPVYNSVLGYAECKTCASNQIINVLGNGCECNISNGWKAAAEGVGIENGCCDSKSNTYSEDINQNICCPAGVQAFRWRPKPGQFFKAGPCCTKDRPYAIEPYWTDENAGPKPEVNCRKCPGEKDTWDANNGCSACPENSYAVYNSKLGYAECITCASNQIINKNADGCECNIAGGWKAATEGLAVENGCCNTKENTYSEDPNQNICCPAGVQAFRWRIVKTQPFKAGPCCTQDRPYAIEAYWTSPNASASPTANCRKCPKATDTWDAQTGCHRCPAGTYAFYNNGSGYADCLTCPPNKVINSAGNGCDCKISEGWKPAIDGVGIESGCCNINTNNYSESAAQNICCPKGVEAFRWRTDANQPFKAGPCCTIDRPYAREKFWTAPNASGSEIANCRKCPSETDTFANGCKSCEAAYPGQNRVPSYNQSLGYAQCVCPKETFEGADGICRTCDQLYGKGASYTEKNGMGGTPHCCHPGYETDDSQPNGCAVCPSVSTYNARCDACLCKAKDFGGNTYGVYSQTNKCTQRQFNFPGAVYSTATCNVVCTAKAHYYDAGLNCCYYAAQAGANHDAKHDERGCLISD